MDNTLAESRERQIFLELLSHPNETKGPENAQEAVAARHGVSLDIVKAIKRKGMARDWPPLD